MDSVAKNVSESWWQYLVLGIVSVIFGIVALVWPGKTLATVIVIFGLFALVMGVITSISALARAGSGRPWGGTLATGVLGILAGLFILRWPGVTALVILITIGIWAIATGVIELVGAFAEHDEIAHAWLLAIGGVISVLFGVAMLVWPGAGLTVVVYLVGIFAIVYGLVYCADAFQVRSLPRQVRGQPPQAPSGSVPA